MTKEADEGWALECAAGFLCFGGTNIYPAGLFQIEGSESGQPISF